MILSGETLRSEASRTGFRADMLEKVAHLVHILSTFFANEFLASRLALKGGTAINLFHSDLTRLSVDIDLNYIGATDVATMQLERPKLEQTIEALLAREGYMIRRPSRRSFAGGKWALRYRTAAGGEGNLEIDINYIFRIPLWPVQMMTSAAVAGVRSENVPVIDVHEVASGKLVALLTRTAARDLYDAWWILQSIHLRSEKLRLAFVVYSAMSETDVSGAIGDLVDVDAVEAANRLVPVLRHTWRDNQDSAISQVRRLKSECEEKLRRLLPFTESEKEFIHAVRSKRGILAELITDDADIAERIRNQPALLWRMHQGN